MKNSHKKSLLLQSLDMKVEDKDFESDDSDTDFMQTTMVIDDESPDVDIL